MKALAIVGVPGTGKTSLMKEFIKSSASDWEILNPASQVYTTYSKSLNLHILGKYEDDEVYAGTDKLGLSCQPHVQEWITNLDDCDILLEGDRLSNTKFFDYLIDKTNDNLNIYILETTKDVLSERYKLRGSNQSETFIKGRETKVSNISGNLTYMDIIQRYVNTNEIDREILVKNMKNYFNIL